MVRLQCVVVKLQGRWFSVFGLFEPSGCVHTVFQVIHAPACWRGTRLVAWLSAARGGALSVRGSVGTGVVGRCTLMCSDKRGQSQRCSSGLKAIGKHELANRKFYWFRKELLWELSFPRHYST